VVAESKSNKWR